METDVSPSVTPTHTAANSLRCFDNPILLRRMLLAKYLHELATEEAPITALQEDLQAVTLDLQDRLPHTIHHALRRLTLHETAATPPILSYHSPYGELLLDEQHQQAASPFLPGEKIHLTPIQTKLLAALMRNPQRIIKPDDAYSIIYGKKNLGTPFELKSHIRYLRLKLGDSVRNEKRLIYSVCGGVSLSSNDTVNLQQLRRYAQVLADEPTPLPQDSLEEPADMLHITLANGEKLYCDTKTHTVLSPFTYPSYVPVHLTPIEHAIFTALGRDRIILSAQAIAQRLSAMGIETSADWIKAHIGKLRKKVGDFSPKERAPRVIHTIPGSGYSIMSLERRIACINAVITT